MFLVSNGVALAAAPFHIDRCYNSMQYWQSIIQNAQAGTARYLKGERALEMLLVLKLPAGSGVCDVERSVPDCCWRAEKTGLLFMPCSASEL